MKLVVDACVFAANQISTQPAHFAAVSFFERCVKRGVTLFAPCIVLTEVASAVARMKQDHSLGELAPLRIVRGHDIQFRNIDEPFAWKAGRLAARHGLRGADALYVALARELKAELVTDDAVLLALPATVAKTISPASWPRR